MLLALIGGVGSGGGGGGGGSTTTNYALLLALTSDVPVIPPPSGTTNYALLLALTSEAGTPPPPRVAGMPGRRPHRKRMTLAEFEAGRERGFSRKIFAELMAAERAAQEAAQATPKKAVRRALQKAVAAAAEVRRDIDLAPAGIDLRPLVAALEMSRHAKKVEETIRASHQAQMIAHQVMAAIKAAQDEEDDEMAMLLLS